MKEKLEEVLALGKREICRRLKERTHKGVRFLRTVRNDVWGFGVKCDGENPTIPTPPPLNMRSTTSNIIKAQKFKDDKGGALAAFIPQTSTLEERTKDGRPRCRALQQRSKLQCKNTARKGQLSCGIKAHQRLVKDQLADSPWLPHSVSLSPPGPPRSNAPKISTATSKSTRKTRWITRPNGYGGAEHIAKTARRLLEIA